MNAVLRESLVKAQNRMKQHADRKTSEREFKVGDWVLLKLQPYKQQSLALRGSQKLSAKFYGPFKIKAMVGKVAYTLQLPPDSKVHPTFHVLVLKKKPEATLKYHHSSTHRRWVVTPGTSKNCQHKTCGDSRAAHCTCISTMEGITYP